MGAYENMIARLADGTDLQEGSFAADNLRAVGAEIDALRAEEIDYLPERFFPTLATGEDLTLSALNFGIERKRARAAEVVLRVSGSPGMAIAAGIRAVGDGVYFDITQPAVVGVDGTALVRAAAMEPGLMGNVAAGVVDKFVTTYAGLTAVTNPDAAYGGTDEETDDDLLTRVRQRWQSPSTGGNAADYIRWALDVPGVKRARVFNPSAGNVDLYIVAAGNTVAADGLIAQAAAAIEGIKPLGASLRVLPAQAVTIDMAATVLLSDGYALGDVQQRITAALEDYLAETAFAADTISYAKLLNAVFVEGVSDVAACTVNGGAESVTLANTEFAALGEVNIDQG